MIGVGEWIPYLNNPLTLVAFVFIGMASILRIVHPSRLSEKLLSFIVFSLVFLAFVVTIGSFWLAFSQIQQNEKNISVPDNNQTKQQGANESNKTQQPTPAPKGGVIIQHSEGDKSPNVVSGGDVNIRY